jgi:hypothetical protein
MMAREKAASDLWSEVRGGFGWRIPAITDFRAEALS